MSVVARVVTDVTGIDKSFDYLVPAELEARLTIGSRVRVDLNNRRVGGWVVELLDEVDADVPKDSLSVLVSLSGNGVEPDLVSLCKWTADRWCGPLRAVLTSASASRVSDRRGQPLRARSISLPDDRVVAATRDALAKGGGLIVVPPLQSAISVVAACAQRGPVLALCPTKRMAVLGAARLRQRGCVVALMPDDWSRAASGVDVVIGTRSAVWAPCPDLSAVIVVDSHDDAFYEERSPTWNAVDVARERAKRVGVPFIETSPTPSPYSISAGIAPTFLSPASAQDGEFSEWPRIVVEDLLEQSVRGSLVTGSLVAALRDSNLTVMSIINVKGRARIVACAACGKVARCPSCTVALSLGSDSRLKCTICSQMSATICQSCGRTEFRLLRRGVAQLRDELSAAANRHVVEVGRDTDVQTLDAASCYVGTEAALHRVTRADVVCLLDLDDELMSQRLSSTSDALALVVRAARIVGRTGTVIVQTREPHHPVMIALSSADRSEVKASLVAEVSADLARRRTMGLPPFRVYARVEGLAAAPDAELGVSVAELKGGATALLADSQDVLVSFIERLRAVHHKIRVYVNPSRV